MTPGAQSFTDTALTAGTTYYYRIAVLSGSSVIAYSNVSSVTVPAPTLNVTLSGGVQGSSAQLSWAISGNASFDGVVLCRSETTTSPTVPPLPGDRDFYIPGNSSSGGYTDSGLERGKTYNYRLAVTRYNQVLKYSNTVTVTVPL